MGSAPLFSESSQFCLHEDERELFFVVVSHTVVSFSVLSQHHQFVLFHVYNVAVKLNLCRIVVYISASA